MQVQAHDPLLRWFKYRHLPEPLKSVSRHFAIQALRIVRTTPPSAERTVALRKNLESKDAAVRALIPDDNVSLEDQLREDGVEIDALG